MKTIQRNKLLDIFKVIAAILVIGLHCRVFYDINLYLYQITANGLFKIVLPLFLCINGYFLSFIFKKNTFRKWLKRIITLYLVWTIIYSFFWFKPFSVFKTIQVIFFGFNHLWYLASLVFGAIVLYIFRNLKTLTLIFILLTLYFIGLTLQYLSLSNLIESTTIFYKFLNYPPFYRNFIFYSFPFLTIGFLLNREQAINKLHKHKITLLLLAGITFTILESLVYKFFYTSEIVINMHLCYLLLGPALLIFALKNNAHLNIDSKLLSDLSIAIYLIHPWVIYLLLELFNLGKTWLTLTTILITVIISYVLTIINKYVKVLL
jgi:surface polysaccharide O-acyltransferase-like enzyme